MSYLPIRLSGLCVAPRYSDIEDKLAEASLKPVDTHQNFCSFDMNEVETPCIESQRE